MGLIGERKDWGEENIERAGLERDKMKARGGRSRALFLFPDLRADVSHAENAP